MRDYKFPSRKSHFSMQSSRQSKHKKLIWLVLILLVGVVCYGYFVKGFDLHHYLTTHSARSSQEIEIIPLTLPPQQSSDVIESAPPPDQN
jgi:type II secretory pathway component PulL